MNVKITVTPMGNKMKIQVHGRVFCTRSGGLLRKTQIVDRRDICFVARNIFGSANNVAKFLNRNQQVTKVVKLTDLGYDTCDSVK